MTSILQLLHSRRPDELACLIIVHFRYSNKYFASHYNRRTVIITHIQLSELTILHEGVRYNVSCQAYPSGVCSAAPSFQPQDYLSP
jgi:hypothetical protein